MIRKKIYESQSSEDEIEEALDRICGPAIQPETLRETARGLLRRAYELYLEDMRREGYGDEDILKIRDALSYDWDYLSKAIYEWQDSHRDLNGNVKLFGGTENCLYYIAANTFEPISQAITDPEDAFVFYVIRGAMDNSKSISNPGSLEKEIGGYLKKIDMLDESDGLKECMKAVASGAY